MMKLPKPNNLLKRARSLIYDRDGPLTRELLLEPAAFGLGKVPARLKPDATVTSICGYCSTGCALNVHLKDGEAVNLTPAEGHPVNLGMACPKGWEALTPLKADDRATTPLLRNRSGDLKPISWSAALNVFCNQFKEIQAKHGDESVAFISTGQIVTEEMALLGALAKFGMGMKHGDGNTRQCMATAVVAYKQAFGFDAPPYTYKDFEESDVIVLVGSNLCIAHPIMWERILMNPHDPDIIVIDPRRTETAMAATDHLALQPKSDLALFYGLAKCLIDNDMIDRDFIEQHTNEFADFEAHVQAFTLERVSQLSGLAPEAIERLAGKIGRGERVSFWWTMGVNQSYEGVRVAQAIINLALMTGNIGRPGTGANSITGQCNAMGSRLYSNTTNLLGGHEFTRDEDRHKVADLLNIPVEKIPNQNSLPYNKIIEGIGSGKIRGLWMIATNGAHSWINQRHFRELIDQLDFFVVQDMYHTTESAQLADLVLPAAGWGEKEGTFINSERRIGRVKKVARAPGEALADFHIFKLIAEAWGCGDLLREWETPEAVFQILKRLSKGQPCDITGIEDYRMIDEAGGIQWPMREGQASETERRLFADRIFFHPDGRARFLFEEPRRMLDVLNEAFPFVLLTGRGSASQWHTQTRTSKSEVLKKLYPQTINVEINPHDAKALGIKPNEWVEVASRRGEVRARAYLTHAVQRGQVFISMHYPETNQLTDSSFDAYSFQPSYKGCAVALRPVQ